MVLGKSCERVVGPSEGVLTLGLRTTDLNEASFNLLVLARSHLTPWYLHRRQSGVSRGGQWVVGQS